MIDAATLLVAVLAPWVAGSAIAFALLRTGGEPQRGTWTLAVGAGWTLGVMLVTLILRVMHLAHLPIASSTAWAVAIVLVLPAVGLAYVVRTRLAPRARCLPGAVSGRNFSAAARIAWLALLGWSAVHFALLAWEVTLRPLFPWEAWTRWATYAKIIAATHAIPRFVAAPDWLQSSTGVWFDAGPGASASVGLLQAWVAALLGRFDDAAMNVPWLATLAALGSVAYAGARQGDARALAALAVATLVVTMPLPEVHVALAGYPDLFAAAAFTAALVVLQAWTAQRAAGTLALALILTLALPYFTTAAAPLAFAIVLALAVAVLGRRGWIGMGTLAGVALLVVLVLTRTTLSAFGHSWHLDYGSQFASVLESWFLLGSWNLLWYGVVAAFVIARKVALRAEWRPTLTALAAALAWLACVAAFPALRSPLGDFASVERLTLMIAPAFVLTACRLLMAWVREAPQPVAAEPIAT